MSKTPINTKQPFEMTEADLTALLTTPFKTAELEITEMLDMLVAMVDTSIND